MTQLNKFIARETDIEVDGKILVVTLTPDNKIKISQKGKGGKVVDISIIELFNQLDSGNVPPIDDTKKMINLHDFRSLYLINPSFDINTKVKLESITIKLLKND